MSINYDEKRNFIRMDTDSKLTFRELDGENSYEGRCLNLSASGILFSCDQHFAPGTQLEIYITPELSVVPPLNAIIEVIRTQTDDENFTVAGVIKQIN